MAELYLIRHAQASFGADNYDLLSDLGHVQSSLLGQYFAQLHNSFDCVITGDMLRHKQTAKGLTDATSVGNVKTDAAWNEFDFDSIVSFYLKMYPEQKPGESAPRSDWYKVLRNAMIAWSNNQIDNPTETWDAFTTRVNEGSQRILQSDYKHLALVTSGGAMAIFMMHLFNLPVEQAIGLNLQIKNTSVSKFYFNKKGFQLHSFNDVPHLNTSQHLSKITYS